MDTSEIEKKIDEMEGKKPFFLSDKHQAVAKEIIKRYITPRYLKKGCKDCNLTGIEKIDKEEHLVHACKRCVNLSPARGEWLEYCKDFPELRQRFLNVD